MSTARLGVYPPPDFICEFLSAWCGVSGPVFVCGAARHVVPVLQDVPVADSANVISESSGQVIVTLGGRSTVDSTFVRAQVTVGDRWGRVPSIAVVLLDREISSLRLQI